MRIDLTGKRFSRLIALEVYGKDKQGRYIWKCICDCGSIKNIPSRHLILGNIKSCGCLRSEVSAKNGKDSS